MRLRKYRNFHMILLFFILSGILSCAKNNNRDSKIDVASAGEGVNVILQMALDLDKFQGYLHPEIEGNEVICISGTELPDNLQLSKKGYSIKVVDSSVDCENLISFVVIEIDTASAHIVFIYEIEGVKCDIRFELQRNEWTIISSELVEI